MKCRIVGESIIEFEGEAVARIYPSVLPTVFDKFESHLTAQHLLDDSGAHSAYDEPASNAVELVKELKRRYPGQKLFSETEIQRVLNILLEM